MTSTLQSLWILTRLRWRLLLRAGLTRYTRSALSAAPLRLIALGALVLWITLTLVGPLTAAMSIAYRGPNGPAQFTSTAVVGISAVTLLVFFYAVLSLVNALTGSGDLRLLLLTPISPRLIVGFKIVAVSLGFSPILLFGVPGLLAAGEALHFGLSYVAAVFALVIIVPMAPVGLAALVVLAVLRWIPPARARSVATTLGVVLGGGLFIAIQLLFGPGRGYTGTAPSVTLPEWLPSTWPGRGLVALGTGDAGSATFYLGATILLAAALFLIAVELAAELLTTGGAGYAEVARRRRVRMPSLAVELPARRNPWLAVLHKDWLTFRRDPQRLATLIYPLLIVAFYLYRLLGLHTVFATQESVSPVYLAGALYGVLVFSAVILIGPVAATIVNREGRSLYLLALAPLSARALFLAKWAFVLAPVLVIVEGILTAGSINLQIDAGQSLLAGLVLALLIAALSGTALTINMLWPRFESASARRQGSGTANLVSFIADLGIGGITCALLIAGIAIWPSYPLIAAALVLAALVLTGGCALLAFVLGTRVLANLLSSDRRPR
jgi:ABC-2 type transport system permease protein